LEQYKVSLEVSNDKGRLQSEREKLSRQLERMRSEMQTYENNIGFLKPSREGEGENFFRREIERKIDHLRKEIQLTEKKIMAIDESNA
jgi:predicted RNase H-like nuclease (RuvC/YqgF family)